MKCLAELMKVGSTLNIMKNYKEICVFICTFPRCSVKVIERFHVFYFLLNYGYILKYIQLESIEDRDCIHACSAQWWERRRCSCTETGTPMGCFDESVRRTMAKMKSFWKI